MLWRWYATIHYETEGGIFRHKECDNHGAKKKQQKNFSLEVWCYHATAIMPGLTCGCRFNPWARSIEQRQSKQPVPLCQCHPGQKVWYRRLCHQKWKYLKRSSRNDITLTLPTCVIPLSCQNSTQRKHKYCRGEH